MDEEVNIALLLLKARKVLGEAQELLGILKGAGKGSPDPVYQLLDTTIWTMEGTLAAFDQGTLRLGDPSRPDSQPLSQEMEAAAALTAPLQALDDAVVQARHSLSV